MEAYDASTGRVFQLHAALIGTIPDVPVYGTVAGWSTKGYNACLVSLEDTLSQGYTAKYLTQAIAGSYM